MKKALDQQKRELAEKRRQFEEDKKSFDEEHQKYLEQLEQSMRSSAVGTKWVSEGERIEWPLRVCVCLLLSQG